jgi:hypothetical protein
MHDEETTKLPAWMSETWEAIQRFRQLEGSVADARLSDRRIIVIVVLTLVSCAALRWLWPTDPLGGIRGFCWILLTIAGGYHLTFVKNDEKLAAAITPTISDDGAKAIPEKGDRRPRRKSPVPVTLSESLPDPLSVPSVPAA